MLKLAMWQKKRNYKPFIWGGIVAGLLIGGGVLLYILLRPYAPLPSTIRSQISFSPFLISSNETKYYRMSDFKYDHSTQVLSYLLWRNGREDMTVSEQPSPPNFSEVPDLYTNLLNGLNQYGTLETYNGTVYLTKPHGGGTVAVLNNQGVLMFIKSSQNPNTDNWRTVIEAMQIYKIANN